MISCMIEELNWWSQFYKGGMSEWVEEGRTRGRFSPNPLQKQEMIRGHRMVKSKSNERFPCIHKKGSVDFHRLNTLPWKNHCAAPSWRALNAMLWLAEESGGESHRNRLSLSWFTVKLSRSSEWRAGVKRIRTADILYCTLDSVCDPQQFRRCHLRLFYCQFVQPLQAIFDVRVSCQLLDILFWITLSQK